jgi:hypothetical protein
MDESYERLLLLSTTAWVVRSNSKVKAGLLIRDVGDGFCDHVGKFFR